MKNDQPVLPKGEDISPLDTAHTQQVHQQIIEWLSVLSHEFRTPLTVINTATSLLLRQSLSLEERNEMLHMVQQANGRLSTLTDRLMELAHLEAGTVKVDFCLVDILSIIQEVLLHTQQGIVPTNHSHFTFELQCQDTGGNPTQEAPLIIGDSRCVHKIFTHLLENAVHFSPKGGPIQVIVRPASSEQSESLHEKNLPPEAFLEVCVCDPGLGIAAQHLEAIFKPFYQVEIGLTREVSGLGIGLAICSHLIALHRGKIWATSQQGQGSTFRVWFPLAVIWA